MQMPTKKHLPLHNPLITTKLNEKVLCKVIYQ